MNTPSQIFSFAIRFVFAVFSIFFLQVQLISRVSNAGWSNLAGESLRYCSKYLTELHQYFTIFCGGKDIWPQRCKKRLVLFFSTCFAYFGSVCAQIWPFLSIQQRLLSVQFWSVHSCANFRLGRHKISTTSVAGTVVVCVISTSANFFPKVLVL